MEENQSILQALRNMGRRTDEWGNEVKEDLSNKLRSFEDYATSNPQDTVVGPAVATGSSMIRDAFLQPVDLDGPKVGAVPMPKFGKLAKKADDVADLTKAKPKDARIEALKAAAKPDPETQRRRMLQAIDKMPDDMAMAKFNKLIGGAEKANVTPSQARGILKKLTEGKSSDILKALDKESKQTLIKRDVRRGID